MAYDCFSVARYEMQDPSITSDSPLSVGKGNEPPLQASKWLDLQLLIDVDELQELFCALGPFNIFKVGSVCPLQQGEISKALFLEQYEQYITHLKSGEIPPEKLYRSLFSSIFTVTNEALFQILVGEERRIIRVAKPVLQLQVNQISYSPVDGKFRTMVFSKDSILWGIQFSYPQLFQDSLTREVFQVLHSDQFPNSSLFKRLQKWTRQYTIPTPFEVNGQKINVPIRIGKKCLSWIHQHPQLQTGSIKVVTSK